LLESDTRMPPAGAGPVKVAVPIAEVPPVTAAGLTLTEESVGGTMVSDAVAVSSPIAAVIVATTYAETGVVVTLKVEVV